MMQSNELSRISSILLSFAFFLFLFGLPSAHGQLYTGSVTGVVTDPQGLVVPSAKVTLTDQEKGFPYNAQTDSDGRYFLRSVPPGIYALNVAAAHFQSQRKTDIKLEINQNAQVNFSLTIGTASEVVQVKAGSVQLQAEDAVTGQVVDRKFINDLPLVGRGLFDLATLAPGVTEGDTQAQGFPTNFNSNGGRNSVSDVLLDGVSSTNFEQNGGIQKPTYTPSVDAVEEFKVQNSFSAEYGFSAGTIFNVVTRSGTDQFHGSLYEFLRNDVLNANDWFANADNIARSPQRLNNFGGTIGGPIRKNHTYFFFDYEATRAVNFSGVNQLGVPDQLQRNGNFGELCTLPQSGNPATVDTTRPGGGTFNAGKCSNPAGQLYDPYSFDPTFNGTVPYGNGNTVTYVNGIDQNTGGVYRGQIIPNNDLANYASPGNPALAGTPFQVRNPGQPGNLLDPVAARMLTFVPFPNRPIQFADSSFSNDFVASGSTLASSGQFDIKIDQRFGENKQISAKYAHHADSTKLFNCFKTVADPCDSGPQFNAAHLFALNYTQTLSPAVVLNISYGLTRGSVNFPGIAAEFPNFNPATDLGLPVYINDSGHKEFPNISLGFGSPTFAIIREGQETHQLGGSVSWVRGKHELKFGGEGRLHRINFTQPGTPAGQFGFGAGSTSQDGVSQFSTGGDSVASFFTGVGSSGQYEIPNAVSTQSFQFAGFVQDNYHFSPKLTLNIGLRYEVSVPRTERLNRTNGFDPNLANTLPVVNLGAIPGAQPLSVRGGEVFASASNRHTYDTDYRDIQPRLGFAYQLPHTFVIRGGYGIYFDPPRSSASGTGPVFAFQGYDQVTAQTTSFQSAGQLPGALLSNPFPNGPLLPVGSSLGPLNDLGLTAGGPIRSVSLRTPYEQTWTFGVEKQLPWKILVDAEYIGKKGTRLYFGSTDIFNSGLNHLPRSVESLTPDQIRVLATVDPTAPPNNPLLPYISDPNSPLSNPNIAPYQDPRNPIHTPFPQFVDVGAESPPSSNSIYHALQVRVEKPFSNGLELLMTYVRSKSIDETSLGDASIQFLGGGGAGGNIIIPQNPNDLKAERSVSTFDLPQVLNLSYIYEIPFGRGKRFAGNLHPILNLVLGGWQTSGIFRVDDGRPIIPINGASNPIPTYGPQRLNVNGSLLLASGSPESHLDSTHCSTCTSYFVATNPDGSPVLSNPAPFTLGNAPRTITTVRQPGARDSSLALFKEFPLASIREGMRLEFRAEAFNAFNHPHFAGPNTTFGPGTANTFGRISSTINSSRELQLGLKFYF
jgi:Carboxypeptidase regulatory-like domain/TonB dependent receptor